MIGDGLGFNEIALARIRAGLYDTGLHMEQFPVLGLQKNRTIDGLLTRSGAAGTALAAGIKTRNNFIGMLPTGETVISLLEAAHFHGMKTGIVVTSSVTHATPAAFYAHIHDRHLQDTIAFDLARVSPDVILGGGRAYLLPSGRLDGRRTDGIDFAKRFAAAGYRVLLDPRDWSRADRLPLLGLFAEDGLTTLPPEPSLAEMTARALALLNRSGSRFFLMVEGSQIDWAGHRNDEEYLVRQVLLFDEAVDQAARFAARDRRTLVIVTADHETGGLALLEKESDPDDARAAWTTRDHTIAPVPIFAYGPGAERFSGLLDNTEIAREIARLLGGSVEPKRGITTLLFESG
ncbi:MAG: alkaline phosphatase [Candidatus Hydrogenedentota bacterium]|nr:MAG: alkaline phosphatase [Candidatus Hydrogenedentota bacterium]